MMAGADRSREKLHERPAATPKAASASQAVPIYFPEWTTGVCLTTPVWRRPEEKTPVVREEGVRVSADESADASSEPCG